jgi:hypothetical protein
LGVLDIASAILMMFRGHGRGLALSESTESNTQLSGCSCRTRRRECRWTLPASDSEKWDSSPSSSSFSPFVGTTIVDRVFATVLVGTASHYSAVFFLKK